MTIKNSYQQNLGSLKIKWETCKTSFNCKFPNYHRHDCSVINGPASYSSLPPHWEMIPSTVRWHNRRLKKIWVIKYLFYSNVKIILVIQFHQLMFVSRQETALSVTPASTAVIKHNQQIKVFVHNFIFIPG